MTTDTNTNTQGVALERAWYMVENPSAWESFDQGASDLLAELAATLETYQTAFDGIEPAAQEGREAVAADFERVADAIENAEFGYSLNLTSLVDGVSTYTLTIGDDILTFSSTGEAYEYVAERKRAAQARAAIAAMPAPPQPAAQVVSEAMVDTACAAYHAAYPDGTSRAGQQGMRAALTAALTSPTDADAAEVTEYFDGLVERAKAAAAKASEKFPQPNYVTLKIAEEAGEVVRGAVHYAENRMEWQEVEGEIVQLLAMLIRFVTEGDRVNGIVPPLTAAKAGEDGRHG